MLVHAAAACTEAYALLSDLDVELLSKLTVFWESVRELSLLGRVFWDYHARDHFAPYLVGASQ